MSIGRIHAPGDRWWRRLDGEPTIHELLNDPVIEAIMARDGVVREDLILLIEEVRVRLERRNAVRELADAACE
jgi:hypothetical protein